MIAIIFFVRSESWPLNNLLNHLSSGIFLNSVLNLSTELDGGKGLLLTAQIASISFLEFVAVR